MFLEEAHWIRHALDRCRLPPAGVVLDVGASTAVYRTREQPHLDEQVIQPLVARGLTVRTLDAKAGAGVDIVGDITASGFSADVVGGRAEIVVCTNVLPHVADVGRAVTALGDLVAPGGLLVVTTPQVYRRTPDPIDNCFRAGPEELARILTAAQPELEVREHASLEICDPRRYRRLASRSSAVPVGGRWLVLPGGSEQVRRRVPRLRWREACVLAQRRG